LLALAGGLLGEEGSHWLGGKVFGEGSDEQKVTALVSGAVIGGSDSASFATCDFSTGEKAT